VRRSAPRCPGLGLLGALAFWLSACVQPLPPAAQPKPASLDAIEYRLAFDAELRELTVKVCFRGQAPASLMCGARSGRPYLSGAFADTAAGRRALPVRDGHIQLPFVGQDNCVSYTLDLTRATEFYGLAVTRRDQALAANVAVLLWRPPGWDRVADLSARLELPAGMQALVPWPRREDGRYLLDGSALAFYGFAVFGRFDQERIEAPGGTLDVAILSGLSAATRAHVAPWLSSAAQNAALVGGSFPRKRAAVVVVPLPGVHEPVRFGMATRGGGASLLLLVSEGATLDALVRDWVAVHEFTHLLHPFVAREDAWLSEGLATYYQEVVRVRAGHLPEADAWRRLYEGSRRGQGSGTGLAQASAGMWNSHAFGSVYWGGAAFALMCDVELRARTRGERTLDDVMRGLRSCCAESARPMTARAVVAEMDRIAGVPVFSELMQRVVLGAEMPDLGPLYEKLGIAVGADRVELRPAEHSAIRGAIMREAEPAAQASARTP
jgi:hypothetical protein